MELILVRPLNSEVAAAEIAMTTKTKRSKGSGPAARVGAMP